MSTAFYPLGMKTYNNHVPQGGYKTWKGTGALSNPVGTVSSHIRPLTNNDSGNVFLSGSFPSRTYSNTRVFLPRPIKHFRKGRVIPSTPIVSPDINNPSDNFETSLINYNMNRFVKSSNGSSLGGGAGGRGLLNEMLDNPGSYIVKQNPPDETSNIDQLDNNCKTCEGVGIVASYYPNTTYLTDNPEQITQNPVLCCNPEYKAKRRAIYASTNIKKNYYTTHTQYLQNRCQTFQQKSFNFQTYKPIESYPNSPFITEAEVKFAKPGSPLALLNTYFANCFPNGEIYQATENALVAKFMYILLEQNIITQQQYDDFNQLGNTTLDEVFNYINGLPEQNKIPAINAFTAFINNPYWGVPFAGPSNPVGCKLVVYKPNNPQYAVQGAVSSSTRILKLNVDTISTNAASIQNYNNTGQQLVTANQLYAGEANNYANLLKNKAPGCNTPTVHQFQNKKLCYYKKLPQYQLPASQPSPYRYYPGVITSSNHFSQSPNTYNTTTGTAAYK